MSQPKRHKCSRCGKPNALNNDRLCPTCKRAALKLSREKAHERAILAKYGVSPEDYRAVLEGQGGKCAICQKATGKTRRLAVDHDHATDEFRGLLCGTCNHRLLGAAHDGTEILKRAIDYLENPPARRILGDKNGKAP